jgi:hypothetical protein
VEGKYKAHLTAGKGSTTKTIESPSLTLQGIDNVHGRDSLATGMFRVGHGIPDDILEEDLEDAAGFLVDQSADALHSTAASEATDRRLGDALDVITEDLAMALGSSFSEAFAAFASPGHGERRSFGSSSVSVPLRREMKN